jgi:hypothetical protein
MVYLHKLDYLDQCISSTATELSSTALVAVCGHIWEHYISTERTNYSLSHLRKGEPTCILLVAI